MGLSTRSIATFAASKSAEANKRAALQRAAEGQTFCWWALGRGHLELSPGSGSDYSPHLLGSCTT